MHRLSRPCILVLIALLVVLMIVLLLVEFGVIHLHSHLAKNHKNINNNIQPVGSLAIGGKLGNVGANGGGGVDGGGPQPVSTLDEVERLLSAAPLLKEVVDKEAGGNETERQRIIDELVKAYDAYFPTVQPEHAVRFYLYDDPSYPPTYQEIFPEDGKSVKNIHVPDNTTLKILVHGFVNQNSSFTHDVKNAFLENTSSPVICVDWSDLTSKWKEDTVLSPIAEKFMYYSIVKKTLPRVGELVGKFVSNLKKNRIVRSLDEVHLLGHSLGAHIAGEAGDTVQADLEGEKIGRITGLDPAGSLFREVALRRRLDTTDAKFVDIIHTSHYLGNRTAAGHVDFYPNSDSKPQPGCNKLNDTEGLRGTYFLKNLVGNFKYQSNRCDHYRAIDYYIKSITNKEMFGCKLLDEASEKKLKKCSNKCDKEVVFGEHVSRRTRGSFCLKIILGEDEESKSVKN